jgi:hypothetical protein
VGSGSKQPEKQPIMPVPAPEKKVIFDLFSYLTQRGVEYKDLRPQGGALWLFGDQKLKTIVLELKAKGFDFEYLPHGGKTSVNKPAWYSKNIQNS